MSPPHQRWSPSAESAHFKLTGGLSVEVAACSLVPWRAPKTNTVRCTPLVANAFLLPGRLAADCLSFCALCRLPVQGGAHWRCRCRVSHPRLIPPLEHPSTALHSPADCLILSQQVQFAQSIHPQRVQPRVKVHHRRRVCNAFNSVRGQDNQGPDMGYRRPRALQSHHIRLLPRCCGRPSRLRHHQEGLV